MDRVGFSTKRVLPALRRVAGRFASASRGAVLPLVAAGLIPMLAAVGSAVDLSRIYLAKSQMQAAVDAAALAGARSYGVQDGSANDRSNQVNSYFTGNFPSGFEGMATVTPQATFGVVNGIYQTTVTASGDLPMLFMRIFGKTSQSISAVARAQMQPRPLEVMAVLDNTGSMAGILDGKNTSMDALKQSMHSFFSILYQGASSRPDLAVGMINYTITTNVGSILKKYNVPYQSMPYFTDASNYAAYSQYANYLQWKGCVADDATHKNMSSSLSVKESDAYDIQRTLPNDGKGMPAIRPFMYPPTYVPKNASSPDDPTSLYYVPTGNEGDANLFLMDLGGAYGPDVFDAVANTQTYAPWFYKIYIGLNTGSGPYVVTNSNGTKYTPSQNFDPVANWNSYHINTKNIPNVKQTQYWQEPTNYTIVVGRSGTDWLKTPNPTPNWQCPEPGLEVAYGRSRSTYDDFIDSKVAPVRPANGTMHHIGFLWGYRLLVRDDVFTRSNPTTEKPKRALIFMTDGVSEFSLTNKLILDRNYTAYGSIADNYMTSSSSKDDYVSAEELRFKKTCEAAKAETNPPLIYIVALNRGGSGMDSNTRSMFKACATGGYYETTSTSAITTAFSEIASELVDLHLTK